MPGLPEILRTHLDYTAWASALLVEAAEQLPPGELTRDFGTADKSILGTLVHIYAADRVWLGRLQGQPPAAFVTEADQKLAVLQNDWPPLLDRWKAWAADLTTEAAEATLRYTDLRGNRWEQPVWQTVLHMVNHGTHHRGQVSGFLRALGHKPPALDLIAYYRSRLTAAANS
jgi:uncharacterized damage-inducible protein DinB